jgi:hypothetical protein
MLLASRRRLCLGHACNECCRDRLSVKLIRRERTMPIVSPRINAAKFARRYRIRPGAFKH